MTGQEENRELGLNPWAIHGVSPVSPGLRRWGYGYSSSWAVLMAVVKVTVCGLDSELLCCMLAVSLWPGDFPSLSLSFPFVNRG